MTLAHSSTSTGSLPEENNENASVTETLLWDRKTEGGFPETKELKNRVRNIIEPGRDLGHIDRSLKKQQHQQVDQNGKKDQGDEKERPVEAGAESQANPDPTKDSGAITAQGAGAGGNVESETDCEDCK